MNKARWVSAAAGTALVSAMFALPGAGVAYASGNGNITGNGNVPILSGNTVNAPVSAPVNLCGVSLAVLGFANSNCQGGASSDISGVGNDSHDGNITGNYNVPVVSGNTVNAPVSAPVNVCGVSGAVGGFANSNCQGGASSDIAGVGNHSHNGNITGNYNVPVVSGNTVNAPVSAPVNLCGVSLALLGFSNAACVGGASSDISGVGEHSHNGNITGNYNVPVGSGNTLNLPVSTPVNVCGDSVAAAGYANSDCQGGSRSCIGEHCGRPMCQASECEECHGTGCHQCQGNECTMCTDHSCNVCTDHSCNVCTDHSCNVCTGHSCNVCTGHSCNVCTGHSCNVCTGHSCNQCTGNQCHQCQGTCTPNVPGTPPHGTGPGTTTTVTAATQPTSSGLPTTGADLLLLGVAALGSIGAGAGTVALARRRRNGEAG